MLASYHDVFGLYGVLAFLSHDFAGYPQEIRAKPRGIGTPLHVRMGTSDAWLCREILLRGQYALNLPFTPRTIVDAGANIGLASIYYARRYPQARIVSVEPEASNFDILCKNVADFPTISPVHAALWKSDGSVSVGERNSAANGSGKWGFVTYEGTGAQVRAITMQTLMREHGIRSIDLLKVDIEGAERELFEECDWVDQVQALAIELHDRFRPGCSAAVQRAMSDFSTTQQGEVTLYLRCCY
jgi:FkbM family methyltransferase